MESSKRLSVGPESSDTDNTKSSNSQSNALMPGVNLSGTNPLTHIYNVSDSQVDYLAGKRVTSNDLPSKKLQYSQWHELRTTEVKGSQLKAPRVRRGPSDKDRQFYELVDDDNEKIHHELKGRSRKTHQKHIEDWENAQLASFTRQEMHHNFQRGSLDSILSRLKNVVFLNLQDNELLTLSSFSFPRCEYINLDNNFLTSLKQLPSLPQVHTLTAKDNDICDLSGLSSLASSPLEELYLIGNPVAFKIGYRYKVFSLLPRLRMLDGVIKQDEDLSPPENYKDDALASRCVIS